MIDNHQSILQLQSQRLQKVLFKIRVNYFKSRFEDALKIRFRVLLDINGWML